MDGKLNKKDCKTYSEQDIINTYRRGMAVSYEEIRKIVFTVSPKLDLSTVLVLHGLLDMYSTSMGRKGLVVTNNPQNTSLLEALGHAKEMETKNEL